MNDLTPPKGQARSSSRALRQPQAVLFDLDGTLIDSVPDITLAVAELMDTEHLPHFGEDDVRGFVGHGVTRLVQRAFAARGVPLQGDDLARMTERMMEIYPRHLTGRTTLMPGTIECLDLLEAQKVPVALVTNKPQLAANIVLDHFALRDRFRLILGDAMRSRTSGLAPKPAPDMLLFAMTRLDAEPRQTLMVGDSASDMQSATAANIFSVAVRGGYSGVPLETFNPGVIIDTLNDFSLALDAWRKAR